MLACNVVVMLLSCPAVVLLKFPRVSDLPQRLGPALRSVLGGSEEGSDAGCGG